MCRAPSSSSSHVELDIFRLRFTYIVMLKPQRSFARQLEKVLQMGRWRHTGSNTVGAGAQPWHSLEHLAVRQFSPLISQGDDPLLAQVLTCPSIPEQAWTLERLASHWHSIELLRVGDLGLVCWGYTENSMLASGALGVGASFLQNFGAHL